MTSPAGGGCWFVVDIRRFIYKFLNVCPFDYTAVVGEWEGWAHKPGEPHQLGGCSYSNWPS